MSSLKSLGIASSGLLERGLRRALHVLSNGLIRIENDDGPDELFIIPTTSWPSGGYRPFSSPSIVDNNIALILLNDSVI